MLLAIICASVPAMRYLLVQVVTKWMKSRDRTGVRERAMEEGTTGSKLSRETQLDDVDLVAPSAPKPKSVPLQVSMDRSLPALPAAITTMEERSTELLVAKKGRSHRETAVGQTWLDLSWEQSQNGSVDEPRT